MGPAAQCRRAALRSARTGRILGNPAAVSSRLVPAQWVAPGRTSGGDPGVRQASPSVREAPRTPCLHGCGFGVEATLWGAMGSVTRERSPLPELFGAEDRVENRRRVARRAAGDDLLNQLARSGGLSRDSRGEPCAAAEMTRRDGAGAPVSQPRKSAYISVRTG